MTKRNRKPEGRNEWNDPALAWRARLKFERKLFLIGRCYSIKYIEYLFPKTVENEGDKDNG